MQTIVDFLEDRISAQAFFERLIGDKALQELLGAENSLPPYTNTGSLLVYLLEGRAEDLRFLINARDALRQFLVRAGVAFAHSTKLNEL